jgi:hypothetical protein
MIASLSVRANRTRPAILGDPLLSDPGPVVQMAPIDIMTGTPRFIPAPRGIGPLAGSDRQQQFQDFPALKR